ncbi:sec1 family domain-containing protein 1 isoform X1 [Lates japonicus]|uniref:Sec1 family domain-containing protein 1 isoform X1 n=1 Tax=Lates japonicus TaxID=270547 RepID=A0AAD3NHE0_LATJO|nr:sec1 family domain-containing protein 1 isoform X1 [Lates japonicus]
MNKSSNRTGTWTMNRRRAFATSSDAPSTNNIKRSGVWREKRAVALKRMLNFNSPPLKNTTAEPVWKVLIYDRFG